MRAFFRNSSFRNIAKFTRDPLSGRSLLLQQRAILSTVAAATDSLSSDAPLQQPHNPSTLLDNNSLHHAPLASNLQKSVKANKQLCNIKPLSLNVKLDDRPGPVAGMLHVPQNYRREQHEGREKTAAILLSGASGGVVGPSSIYLSMADKLASLRKGIPVLRLDYRYPAQNKYCVNDVKAAMTYLENGYGVSRFVLVGWSFGGAVVYTLGGSDDRVVAVATVASQTAETNGIKSMAPKPVLLLHGTEDQTLRSSCSQQLYDAYGAKGSRRIEFFQSDDHALKKAVKAPTKAEGMLGDFIMESAGVEIGEDEQREVMARDIVEPGDRVEKMIQGGDSQKPESTA